MKIDCALRLAEQGFRVFPLQPNGKKPLPDSNGYKDATADVAAIRAWWATNPDYNIGVATGGGMFVIDADCKDGRTGLEDLGMLDDLYGLPRSLRVVTASGGYHVYLAKTEDHKLVSNAGKVDGFPGLDIRAEGGYVVGPGSTIDGVPYSTTDLSFTLAPCPAAFFPLLRKPLAERLAESSIELDLPQNVDRAIDWLIHQADEAIDGAGGDQITYSVAAELRAKGISESLALELMLEHWNEIKAHPPWQPDELAIKVANGFQYGQGAPGGKTAAGEFGEVDLGDNQRVSETRESKPDARLKFLTYAEMLAMPEPEWLVEGVVQKRSAALMFGKSNTFKSFLAIDIGLSVATNRPWHGHAVKQGRVLFVATEGANGVGRLRIPGWYEHYGVPEAGRANALLYPQEIALDVKEDVDALVQSVRAWGGVSLITLDIFGGTMIGAEKDDETAKAWAKAIQRIMRATGAATLTVAHTGFAADAQGRARMHSHQWGSFDSRLRVEGDKEKLTTCLAVDRHKDADSTGSWGFAMRPTNGTLVPEFDESVKADKAAALPSSLRVAMAALDDAVQAHGILNMGASWPDCKMVDMKIWREFCDNHELSSGEPDAKRKAFQRAKDGLLKRNCIDVFEGFAWSKFGA